MRAEYCSRHEEQLKVGSALYPLNTDTEKIEFALVVMIEAACRDNKGGIIFFKSRVLRTNICQTKQNADRERTSPFFAVWEPVEQLVLEFQRIRIDHDVSKDKDCLRRKGIK